MDASAFEANTKVKVTFMNCRSDQKRERQRQKFKIVSLNTTFGEGENLVFPQMYDKQ